MTDNQYKNIHMKKIIISCVILLSIASLLCIYVSEHLLYREFQIFGSSYKNDLIIVKYNKRIIFEYKVVNGVDFDNIGNIYKTRNLITPKRDIQLNVLIYSNSKICILDSIVTISKENKEPFISFISPLSYKKENIKFFIGDNSKILKY